MQYRVPREILHEIQARTSLVEVIGRYVSLQKRGRSYVGLCPFHSEKSPSFHVDETKRMFYCFGCQVGGDVFKFLTLIENEGFMEVVRELAAKCGIEIPERELSRDEKRSLDEREQMLHLLEVAAAFYERKLLAPESAHALAYFESRGLPHPIIQEYRLGYAPDGWRNLVDYLTRLNLPLPLAAKAGLIASKEGGGFYDRFRERVIFPIRNVRGKVIAFGGRILGPGEPKYLNSPETPLFNKSEALYGLDAARSAIGHENSVVVVEGYFDTLALHAAGIRNVVATCGTSLTRQHLEIIRRYTQRVVVMYDGDRAGQAAAERSLSLFLDAGMWPSFIMLPEGKDPDDVVRAEGTEVFKQRIAKAVPLLDHLIMRYGAASLKSSQDRDAALETLAPVLARLKPEQMDFYANRVAQHFALDPHITQDYLMRVRARAGGGKGRLEAPTRSLQPPVPRATVVLPPHEEYLVHWILQRPEEIMPAVIDEQIVDWLTHDGLRQIVSQAMESFQQGTPIEAAQLIAHVSEPGLQTKLSELCVKELTLDASEKDKAVVQSLLGIKEKNIQYHLRHLQGEIARLEREGGNSGELARLAMERMDWLRKQNEIKRRRSGSV